MGEGKLGGIVLLPAKGCLGLYAAWAGLVALFVGFLRRTGGRDDALSFGFLLPVLPGAMAGGLWWGERLLRQASARLGFRIRKAAKEGRGVLEPSFDAEECDAEWFATPLEGKRDGVPVAACERTGRDRRSSRSAPRRTLGVIRGFPGVRALRLILFC